MPPESLNMSFVSSLSGERDPNRNEAIGSAASRLYPPRRRISMTSGGHWVIIFSISLNHFFLLTRFSPQQPSTFRTNYGSLLSAPSTVDYLIYCSDDGRDFVDHWYRYNFLHVEHEHLCFPVAWSSDGPGHRYIYQWLMYVQLLIGLFKGRNSFRCLYVFQTRREVGLTHITVLYVHFPSQ